MFYLNENNFFFKDNFKIIGYCVFKFYCYSVDGKCLSCFYSENVDFELILIFLVYSVGRVLLNLVFYCRLCGMLLRYEYKMFFFEESVEDFVIRLF